MNVTHTLRELVGINSVSSRSNLEISEFIARRCQLLNLPIKRFPYRDENQVEKQNLVALAGADFVESTQVELALVGHTDTVPFDPNWTEALLLTEDDGKLYGRGACDTKAFIAAMLSAVQNIDPKTLKRPLALIFTADEEVGLMGAKRLADARPLRARYSIVGEPTSLHPMRAGKGYSLAEVLVKGREAHSAYPAVGASAVFRASRLLQRLESIATNLESDRHEAFDPPYTTLNVGLVSGGTAKNVIPGECRFTLEWRPIPGQGSARVLELLTEAIAQERAADSDFECVVDATRADEGFETTADSNLVKMLEEATGNSAGTVSFGTEAAQMIALGAHAVVFGPGDIRVAHRTGEFVPVDELEKCVEVMSEAIVRFCS
jgi:acetylornithine deacetylase